MKFDKLLELHADDLVYRTITAFEAPSAVVLSEFDGAFVTPQTFPTYSIDQSQLLPGYMALLTTAPEFHEAMATRCVGSVLRRKTLSQGAFESIPVALPPLDEQRRIVDLIAAVDDAVEAAEVEAAAAISLQGAMLDATAHSETAAIGSLASLVSGASWGKADVRTDMGDGVTPVLTIANTKPDGSIGGEPTLVHGLSTKAARLTASSLITIRTNGNHNRIGNVYRVPEEHLGAAVSAFQFVVEPFEPADSAYMHWMMRAPSFQAAVTSKASGSTGLGNIGATKFREMRIPWPADQETRMALAKTFARVGEVANIARVTADALRTLRSNLLTVLLSGRHEIPASYDALLEGDVL
jgi:hypothetical protein